MRLKSFYAKTMTEAMHMVRETLGEDAIIVATREERGGKTVCVTAAIEQMERGEVWESREKPGRGGDPGFELGRGGEAAQAQDWLQYDQEDEELAVAEELTDIMIRHGVPEDVTDMILSCATVMGLAQPHIALIAALEHLFAFRPLPVKAHRKALMMVGMPGSGKTLATAKIAARGVMNGLRVAVITCDTIRAGGIEQLASFTKLLQVPLLKSVSPADLKKCLEKTKGADLVLIDTGGLNPFNTSEIKDLARLIAAGDIDPVLVMPAGGDAEESGDVARIFATLGVRWMLPTRLDIARRFGGLLQAAYSGGLSFADASSTPQVADGLTPLDPQRLCALLMPGAAEGKKTKAKTG